MRSSFNRRPTARRGLKRRLLRVKRTLRKEQEAHSALKSEWRSLLADLRTAVVLLDESSRIVHANRAAGELLLAGTRELIGKSIETFAPQGAVEHPFRPDLLRSTLAQQPSLTTKTTVAVLNGSERTVELTATKLAEGRSRYAVQMRQVDPGTPPRHPQPDEPEKIERRSTDEVLATMCHELRTPLQGLIATLDILRDERLSETGSQQLAVAKASARTMLKLANDLLDVARIDAGEDFPLKQAPFCLDMLLHETVAQYNARASAKGLTLWLLISADDPSYLIGDRQRVKQIVSNLLTNAIKFTTSGPIVVEVTYANGIVQIDVHDSGPGIPKEKQEAIFRPFVQVGPKRNHGTGLGLSISRRLCKAMGGQLNLVTSSPLGSTFRITLPLPRSEQLPETERSPGELTNPQGHVLVVDDHPVNQFVVRAMLDSLKCSSTLASSGEQALKLLEAQNFDLILMDFRMPGLDGIETIRRIRRLSIKQVPIVAMTADVSIEKREIGRAAGMNDYLIKPFGKPELNRILRTWLSADASATRSSARNPAPVIDEAVFTGLWESVNWQAEPLRNIATSFKETIAQCVAAFELGNSEEIRRHLHTVIGTGGMIGAMEIRDLASRLRNAYKANNTSQLRTLISDLLAASVRFEQTLFERLEEQDC